MNVKIIGTVLGGLIIAAGAQDDPNPTPPQQGPTVGLSDLKPVRSTDAAQVTRRVAPETQKKQSDQEDRLKLLGGGSLDGNSSAFMKDVFVGPIRLLAPPYPWMRRLWILFASNR